MQVFKSVTTAVTCSVQVSCRCYVGLSQGTEKKNLAAELGERRQFVLAKKSNSLQIERSVSMSPVNLEQDALVRSVMLVHTKVCSCSDIAIGISLDVEGCGFLAL